MHIDIFVEKVRSNIWGLATLSVLMRQDMSNLTIPESIFENSCSDYVTIIGATYIAEFQSLPADQKLVLFERFTACLPHERRDLLVAWKTDLQWMLGRYDEVCDTLLVMQAPTKLLELTWQAAEGGNWMAVEMGLDCVKRFPADGPWVSPFIVASLYNRIGQHYEERADFPSAVEAYDAAARLYPVVWADPYLKKAALLRRQGAEEEAILWLVAGVSQSTDVTATFYLWRALGGYWQQDGDLIDAVCAYRLAAQIMDQVPSQNLPEAERALLLAQIEALPTASEACFQKYPSLLEIR